MVEVNITKAVNEVTRKFRNLTQQQINAGIARAMNHVIAIGRTAASKKIREQYKIKPKYLGSKGSNDQENRNSSLRVHKASTNTLKAMIQATGRPLPLVAFPSHRTRKGITIQIMTGKTKSLPGAFYATMKSGHRGIFARGRYGGGKFISRRVREKPYPETDTKITELTTASVPTAFLKKTVTEETTKTIRQRFGARFEHEIGRLFG